MRNFVIRLFANALALWGAAEIFQGVRLSGGFADVLWVALVFGLVNAFLKPLLLFFSLPLLFLSLGLFTLVINAALLLLTDQLTEKFAVEGFATAFLAALFISVVSMFLSGILKDDGKKG